MPSWTERNQDAQGHDQPAGHGDEELFQELGQLETAGGLQGAADQAPGDPGAEPEQQQDEAEQQDLEDDGGAGLDEPVLPLLHPPLHQAHGDLGIEDVLGEIAGGTDEQLLVLGDVQSTLLHELHQPPQRLRRRLHPAVQVPGFLLPGDLLFVVQRRRALVELLDLIQGHLDERGGLLRLVGDDLVQELEVGGGVEAQRLHPLGVLQERPQGDVQRLGGLGHVPIHLRPLLGRRVGAGAPQQRQRVAHLGDLLAGGFGDVVEDAGRCGGGFLSGNPRLNRSADGVHRFPGGLPQRSALAVELVFQQQLALAAGRAGLHRQTLHLVGGVLHGGHRFQQRRGRFHSRFHVRRSRRCDIAGGSGGRGGRVGRCGSRGGGRSRGRRRGLCRPGGVRCRQQREGHEDGSEGSHDDLRSGYKEVSD